MKITAFGLFVLGFAHVSGAQPAIYRCTSESGLVFSDRPCAAGADAHEIDDSRVTVYKAPPEASGGSGTASKRTARSQAPARSKVGRSKAARGADPAKHQAQHQARCAKLEQGLRDVRTKMRTGYGAKEGERLKARQRKLNEQRRTQKCR
jgi:hypothetical protein